MVHSAVEEIGIFHNLVAGDAFDMSDKANATCIALEARVVQPLLLWEPYTLIDSLGHTDLFVSVLFAAIRCYLPELCFSEHRLAVSPSNTYGYESIRTAAPCVHRTTSHHPDVERVRYRRAGR